MNSSEAQSPHIDPQSLWDEYRWEAVIRHQDQQAGEYLALVEYYGEHPNAHNLIARAMGWNYLLTNCRREPDPRRCLACPPAQRRSCHFHQAYFSRPVHPLAVNLPTDAQWNARYAQHPVRVRAAMLIRRLRRLGLSCPCVNGRPEQSVCRLLHQGRCCTAKISAALAGATGPIMLGRVIAYLKMARQGATACEALIGGCVSGKIIEPAEAQLLRDDLAAIRSDLKGLIGEFRLRLGALCRRVGS